ncbi:unnamed protein product [Musa banksii]
MGRSSCCSREKLKKGAWSAVEDKVLRDYIRVHGEGKWGKVPKKAGLNRCPRSCRLRWLNYLRPDIKRGNISDEEEDLIIRLHNLLGNRYLWSLIAGRLPGRTDNEIKNYWNTVLKKKLQAQPVASTATTVLHSDRDGAATLKNEKEAEASTQCNQDRAASRHQQSGRSVQNVHCNRFNSSAPAVGDLHSDGSSMVAEECDLFDILKGLDTEELCSRYLLELDFFQLLGSTVPQDTRDWCGGGGGGDSYVFFDDRFLLEGAISDTWIGGEHI